MQIRPSRDTGVSQSETRRGQAVTGLQWRLGVPTGTLTVLVCPDVGPSTVSWVGRRGRQGPRCPVSSVFRLHSQGTESVQSGPVPLLEVVGPGDGSTSNPSLLRNLRD